MERGILLYSQDRCEMAAEELRNEIAKEPDNWLAYCFLALSLLNLEQLDGAQAAADRARQLEPDNGFPHFVMSRVLQGRNLLKDALAAVDAAITLEPEDKNYYMLRASIHIDMQQWDEVLKDSERALEIDAEFSGAHNFRAIALRRLGRESVNKEDLERLLAKNPEDSVTHSNYGWSLLHTGDHVRAKEHFQEALRLSPTNALAREGYIDCLKSRSSMYSVLLRILLWQGQLFARFGWKGIAVALGGYLLLSEVAKRNPLLDTVMSLAIGAIYIVLFISFAAPHIFNLLLRMDAYGKHLLTDDERRHSTWIGGWFFLLAILSYLHAMTGSRLWQPFPMMMIGMMIVLISFCNCEKGWPRDWLGRAFLALLVSWVVFLAETIHIRSYALNLNLAIPSAMDVPSAVKTLDVFSTSLQHLLDLLEWRSRHFLWHIYGMIATLVASFWLEDIKAKK